MKPSLREAARRHAVWLAAVVVVYGAISGVDLWQLVATIVLGCGIALWLLRLGLGLAAPSSCMELVGVAFVAGCLSWWLGTYAEAMAWIQMDKIVAASGGGSVPAISLSKIFAESLHHDVKAPGLLVLTIAGYFGPMVAVIACYQRPRVGNVFVLARISHR